MEATMNPHDLEPVLSNLIRLEINRIALLYPEQVFYGFALDVNVSYGDVYISLNTRDALDAHCSARYVSDNRSLEDCIKELEWQFGDWSYKCVNRGSVIWEAWGKYASDIEGLCERLCEEDREEEWEEWQEEFLRSACRVLLALQSEGAFESLHHTPDFRVMCADHDEPVEQGQVRMEKMRSDKDFSS